MQSPPEPIGCWLQPPADLIGLFNESMQPLAPPAHLKTGMPLTPPPLENTEVTRMSPSRWFPAKSTAPPVDEQFTLPSWRNQNAALLVPLSLFFSSAKYRILSPFGAVYAAE